MTMEIREGRGVGMCIIILFLRQQPEFLVLIVTWCSDRFVSGPTEGPYLPTPQPSSSRSPQGKASWYIWNCCNFCWRWCHQRAHSCFAYCALQHGWYSDKLSWGGMLCIDSTSIIMVIWLERTLVCVLMVDSLFCMLGAAYQGWWPRCSCSWSDGCWGSCLCIRPWC